MNVIFTAVTLVSLIVLTVTAPNQILPAVSEGVEKAITLSGELLIIYTFWFSVFEVLKSGPISRFLTKILYKPIGLIYGKTDEKAKKLIAMNHTCNLLGLGQIATPLGIEAESILENNNDTFGQTMLFVTAATGLQIFPTSIIALRTSYSSASPEDVIIPIILSSLVNFAVSVALTKILVRK